MQTIVIRIPAVPEHVGPLKSEVLDFLGSIAHEYGLDLRSVRTSTETSKHDHKGAAA